MRLLDLFCGAGGAAMGYHQAGFDDIVGVDIVPQPNYPFEFVLGDALDPMACYGGERFDLIHASPPCQAYSTATPSGNSHPELIEPTRRLLESTGRPYVIENVIGAPIRPDLKLCGSMFGLEVQRHRLFEFGEWFIWNPPTCDHKWKDGRPWSVVGNAGGRKPWHQRTQKSLTHSFKYKDLEHARDLMGMPWVQTTREVTEAIPRAYTKFIGEQFLAQM